ncbi:MAG: DNA methylase N-4, partial [Bacillota bacterium]
NDLGHTDDDEHFFQHLGYLTPELLRVLKPGRVAAVHVKDRIVPGGLSGFGFQTVSPFSDYTIAHFRQHGFAFLGRKTIVTDVVRENNQTYRLGWTEQCKDGSRMGCGMPEYLLLFRKPPTDRSNGYADEPVVKSKERYSRSRWQIDAHGFARSSGNRLIDPEELKSLPHEKIFKLFRDYSLAHVYDFEYHVKLGEALEQMGRLPVTFMLLQPPSWHPDVWTDIARMRTLNCQQERKGQEMHLCPLAFDLVDRVIEQFSMPGELVFDPFGGLMTVPYCAIRKGRRGLAVELNPTYFTDGAAYCEAAERQFAMPSLFDLDTEGVA